MESIEESNALPTSKVHGVHFEDFDVLVSGEGDGVELGSNSVVVGDGGEESLTSVSVNFVLGYSVDLGNTSLGVSGPGKNSSMRKR